MSNFYDIINKQADELKSMGDFNLIIGIPFYNESESIIPIINAAINGVISYPVKINAAIICAGDPAGQCVVDAINERTIHADVPIKAFLMQEGINGKGWSTRAILEIAKRLHADVAMLEADLICAEEHQTYGMSPQWITQLLDPIYNDSYSVALASFSYNPMDNPISSLIAGPLFASVYGYRLDDPMSGIWAITADVVEEATEQMNRQWNSRIGGYGIDAFMSCVEITSQQNICRIMLGPKPHKHSTSKRDVVFIDIVTTLFERIKQDESFWRKEPFFLKGLDTYGIYVGKIPSIAYESPTDMLYSFKSDFSQYYNLLSAILPEKLTEQLERISEADQPSELAWDHELWARLTYHVLISYCYPGNLSPEDAITAYAILYKGYIASLTHRLETYLQQHHNAEWILNAVIDRHVTAFILHREDFLIGWEDMRTRTLPFLPKIGYMEFIPYSPILLPHEVSDRPGHSVNTIGIYNELLQQYIDEFHNWITDALNIDESAGSWKVGQAMSLFMDNLENIIDEIFPGNLESIDGLQQFLNALTTIFPHGQVLTLKPNIAQLILETFPPVNLMLFKQCANLSELLNIMNPNDALSLAILTEDDLRLQLNNWLIKNGRPEYMGWANLKIFAVESEKFPTLRYTALDKLNGRVIAHPIPKGIGGRLPRLRYFTRIAKHMAEAEHLASIWSHFLAQRHGFGEKIVNSISGHWGKDMLSAYSITEDWHQERVAECMAIMSEATQNESHAKLLKQASAGYRLGLTMPDGTFMPCSAWSWASYCFKGGRGIPSPMSIHVEKNAFARRLLETICIALGIDKTVVLQEAIDLMAAGRAYESVAPSLFYMSDNITEDIVYPSVEVSSPAKPLKRYINNPIIEPIEGSWWESVYTLNAAALRIGEYVYLMYRAVGSDGISRLGLAITKGFEIIERLPEPIFVPEMPEERRGCEDPRLVMIGDRIYMTYTAFDGIVAQIAVASISVDDFLARRFDKWQRHGMAFPGFTDKDAVIFPEKVNGLYPIYHRTEPSIWISYTPSLECPWPRQGHKIIMGPRSGLMWDARKVGAGSQPIKTEYGWLMIYHGIDNHLVYRLGSMLADINDPSRILYRSPNPVLSPETSYEIGEKGKSWVPNVVFTCGAVPMTSKEILGKDDEIIVYYGAADSVLCAASGRVGDLMGLA